MERIMCVLDENKECDNCMECETCDLDPNKICDNCGKCLDIKDFVSLKVEKVVREEEFGDDKPFIPYPMTSDDKKA